jgi:ATP-dependent Clp protease adaptor protein ClpS
MTTIVEHPPKAIDKAETFAHKGFVVICWNDPVNLMNYVTLVFQKTFGWSKAKAQKHMLEVHHVGKSILIYDSREKAEHYVHQLQSFQLTATMEPAA